ncbi:ShlB/FhaC/HecB family hemolysin secretion/activation protein [Chitinimonas koreensis]|uniref:ShlB/FhaC/HecB family hemolysin secretion/activation protein n=1 Tax=Chitinimonas koreensis TaxID=356302 RepID=UPI000553E272|nr:ShlB/FhaC/HecB family hemolysin secretion/activation protein [Chitinimonas koreensis]QNM97680.1 ShlB/FhaC/HecB family hemolysin secretion/activation protein [Chitinimonas koreensis]
MNLYAAAFLVALATTAAAAEETIRFPIQRFQVDGNTVLPGDDIQSALKPYLGEGRDFADVQRALEALEALYRRAGYGAMQVYLPEQELNQGVVTLKVVEAKLGEVHIEGNQYFGEQNIRRALPALKEGAVPNTAKVARDLRLANDSPSRRMVVSLQGGDTPQLVDVAVKVTDEKPWRAFALADNTGDDETGRSRLSFGYQHSNLFDRDHVLTAQATTSPEKPSKVKIFGLGYRLPIYGWGDSLTLYGGYSNVDSGALQGLFNVNGKGKVAGARYALDLPARGDYQHKLLLGVDWRRFETQTTFASGTQLPDSTYTLRPASLTYQAQRQGPRWSYDFNLGAAYNMGQDYELERATGRQGARLNYGIARLGGNLYFSLPAEWTVHAGLNAQFSDDALPAGEQFGLGGANSVRGFDERALSNDSGLSVSFEGYTPELTRGRLGDGLNLRALAFADWGRVSRNLALPGEAHDDELAGAGLGLRLGWGKYASLKVDVASALKDGGNRQRGDTKAHVSAVVSY